jgi:3-hydroxybutyryl-CoA dehydrogenase
MALQDFEIKKILVVGAGTMGQQIALQCAMHGYQVNIYDIAPQMLETAQRRIVEYVETLQQVGGLTDESAQAALGRLQYFKQPEAAAKGVDLLSESVLEDPKVKGGVFAQFNKLCPARTLFTTNTSTLLPSKYAQATGRPAQFAAFHFHNPVWEANVVDVMPHPGTSAEVTPRLVAFAHSIAQIPIVLQKETPGYVFNAMLDGILQTAMLLAADGKASVEDIDRSWMGVTKMRVGPFGMIDLVGVDLVYHIVARMPLLMRMAPPARRLLRFLKGYVDQGRLGIKSHKGFYEYPDPIFSRPEFLSGESFPLLR